MSEYRNHHQEKERQFAKTVVKILHKEGFLSLPPKKACSEQDYPNLLMKKGKYTYCVEIKYSRDKEFSRASAVGISEKLERYKKYDKLVLLVVAGGEVSNSLSAEFLRISHRTVVVDIKNLLYMAWPDVELYTELVSQLQYTVIDLKPEIPDLLPIPDWNSAYGFIENWRVSTGSIPREKRKEFCSSDNMTPDESPLDGGSHLRAENANVWDDDRTIVPNPATITLDLGASGIDLPGAFGGDFWDTTWNEPSQRHSSEKADSLLRQLEMQKMANSKELQKELGQWKGGKGTAQSIKYEKLCTKVLKRLFADDLTLWQEQVKSNEELYRFDMICKIKRDNRKDFWETAEHYFHSKYIIFEFKNYSQKVTQMEVTTTARYLYAKALRGIAIIVSPKGTNNNADKAIRGVLRDEGKLILSMTNEELIEMLQMQDNGECPSDYLSDKLDQLLIDLEK